MSTEVERDLKIALGWNKFNFRLIGIWPDESLFEGSFFSKYRFLIPSTSLIVFLIIPQCHNLPYIWGDVSLISENFSTGNISNINAVAKITIIWHHRKVLKALLQSFYNDWHEPKSSEDRGIMMTYAYRSKSISTFCTILTHITLIAFYFLRLAEIYGAERNDVLPYRLVIFPARYPFDVGKSPVFELTNMAQSFGGFWASTCFSATDSVISMLVLHACGQLEILRKKLETLTDDRSVMDTSEEYLKQLTKIVQRHEHLIWFCMSIENCFNILLLLQILFGTTQLCFQGFVLLQNLMDSDVERPVLQIIFMLIFVTIVTLPLYIYCHVGEMLIIQSSGMADSAYATKWYEVSIESAKCMLLIMQRGVTPLQLTAGKFSMFSMELFSTIMKTAAGYLSVLITVASTSN